MFFLEVDFEIGIWVLVVYLGWYFRNIDGGVGKGDRKGKEVNEGRVGW